MSNGQDDLVRETEQRHHEAEARHESELRHRGEQNDPLEYVASYDDLIRAIGVDDNLARGHQSVAGKLEGRHASFDGLEYIASYGDLINAFGSNDHAGAAHYITS